MAQIENEVYAVLSGTGSITALVSTRIFPASMPQAVSAFPAIVYTKTGGSRISHLGGYSGLQNSDIEINIYAVLSPFDDQPLSLSGRYRLSIIAFLR